MDIRVKGLHLVARPAQLETKSRVAASEPNPWHIQRDTGPGSEKPGPGSEKKSHSEKRHKYLQRKYSTLWLQHAFGRMHPSNTRIAISKGLQGKFFRLWHYKYWQNRIEWKLEIRGNCHNKFRLFTMCFAAWRQYVRSEHHYKAVCQRAQRFAELKLIQKAWHGWRLFMEIKQGKRQLIGQAQIVENTNLMRYCWTLWTSSTEQKVLDKQEYDKALQFYRQSMFLKIWKQWRKELQEQRNVHHLLLVTRQHFKAHLQSKVVHNWRAYVLVKREEKQLKSWADSYYCGHLLQVTNNVWKCRWLAEERLRDLEQHATAKMASFLTLLFFRKWRNYVQVRHCYEGYLQQAALFHQRRLLKKCWSGLKRHSSKKQFEASQRQAADSHRKTKLLNGSWNLWSLRLEAREEKAMSDKYDLAWTHYRQHVVSRAYKAWSSYVESQRQAKALLQKAVEHFESHELPKYFGMWVAYHSRKHEELIGKQSAMQQRGDTLLARAYYSWLQATELKLETQLLEGNAKDHYALILKRRILKVWRQRTTRLIHTKRIENIDPGQEHTSVQDRDLMQRLLSQSFHNHTLLSGACTVWKAALLARHRRFMLENQAVAHYNYHCLHYHWNLWIKCQEARSAEQMLEKHHLRLHSLRVLSVAYRKWKAYHQAKLIEKKLSSHAKSHSHLVTLRQFYQRWKSRCDLERQLRRCTDQAVCHHSWTVQRKYLQIWQLKCAVAAMARRPLEEQLEKAQGLCNRVTLRSAFATWRHASAQSLLYKNKLSRAKSFHKTQCIRKCLQGWKDFHLFCQKKMVMNRISLWFSIRRHLAEFYSTWKLQYQYALEEKQKSIVALWHWNRRLKFRCVSAWVVYVQHKKAKRARYSAALVQYRHRLLRIGVSAWMQMAEYCADDDSYLQQDEQPRITVNTEDHVLLRHYFTRLKTIASVCSSALTVGEPPQHKGLGQQVRTERCSGRRLVPRIPVFLMPGDEEDSKISAASSCSQSKPVSADSVETTAVIANAVDSSSHSNLLETVKEAKQFLLDFHQTKTNLKACQQQLDAIDPSKTIPEVVAQVRERLKQLTHLVASKEPLLEAKMRALSVTLSSLGSE